MAFNTGQQIFRDNVQTLKVSNPYDFMAPPVIRIGSDDRLNINFDIIGDSHEYLRYRIIHCNADWQPSNLIESQYLRGFNEVQIEDYAYSSNTYIHYVNYNISLPDPALPIIHSGNYLLQVYPENDPDDIILQARFSVSEEKAPVDGYYTSRTDKGYDTEFQQLYFNINTSSLGNINPYQDLHVAVTQNNRPETSRIISHPLKVESGKAFYEHSPLLIFDAGNEYRRFETVRTDYPGMHVDSVKFVNNIWNSWLQPDKGRKYRNYQYDSTQHGRFKIDEYNSTDPDLSADYVLVHFSFEPDERINGAVYLDGDFTNHNFTSRNLMRYNWDKGVYEAAIPLKQGSYNYQYVVMNDNGTVSAAPVEGNKYETNNEYLIQVFLRTPGSRGDRLLSSFVISSN